jgi:Restriction endonuclease S subunits
VKKGKSTVVPRLRFPEFRTPWKSMAVSDFFNLASKAERTHTFDRERLLTVRLHGKGVVKNEKLTITGGANYFSRTTGQFIFSKIDLLNGAFGIVPDELDGYSSSSDVPAYSFNAECSSAFFLGWLTANYARLQIERTGTSSTLKRVSPVKFLMLDIVAPSLAEQQKIANCLTSLDELIAAQGRKVEALKTFKRGLMQQLFPREGETLPRLRFPEFKNNGEWVEKPLGKILPITSSKRVHESEWTVEGVPFYRAREIVALSRLGPIHPLFISEELYRANSKLTGEISEGHLLVTGVGSIGVPYLVKNGDRFYFKDGNIIWLKNDESQLIGGLLYRLFETDYVQRQIRTMASVGTVGTYTIDNAKRTIVVFPANRYEQQRIVDCLSDLDSIITAEFEKLDTLKTHKKALMQQLFPSPKEV